MEGRSQVWRVPGRKEGYLGGRYRQTANGGVARRPMLMYCSRRGGPWGGQRQDSLYKHHRYRSVAAVGGWGC